jgi:hypothetical protein
LVEELHLSTNFKTAAAWRLVPITDGHIWDILSMNPEHPKATDPRFVLQNKKATPVAPWPALEGLAGLRLLAVEICNHGHRDVLRAYSWYPSFCKRN